MFGNPPFVGAKYQSEAQRTQVRRIARLGGSGGTLDYVAAWLLKAADYARTGGARIAFVATNSICQGEQVAQLWPKLFEKGMEIAFAHRTFVWPGRAAVHCVIVGLAPRGSEPQEKRLFVYGLDNRTMTETRAAWIDAYLGSISEDVRFHTVSETSVPINGMPRLVSGSQPIDGGHYIFDARGRAALLAAEPAAVKFLRPFIGSEEYLYGGERWILALQDASPTDLRSLPTVRERMRLVRELRSASKRTSTLKIAATPAVYNVTVIPEQPFLVIPEVSSERRLYIPIGWLKPPAIPSNLVRVLDNASLYEFGVLTSSMHMAWLRHIGGRLESRYRYSIGLVYNTFPWPDPTQSQRLTIESLAQGVLDAREMPKNATSNLADLYDPDRMPAELYRAHKALDAAVDRLYSPKGFADDRARVEHLFRRYEALVQPTAGAAAANRRTARRVGRASGGSPSG